MCPNSVISTNSLTRRFGDTLAVDRLTLEVFQGEVFGFLGHNGAGKTTTVRLLNGILGPSEGKATVLGLDPLSDGSRLRSRTGVLTETPSLDERLTGRENLEIYADMYGVPVGDVKRRVEEVLIDFELSDRADEKTGGYSKGMKQRLALARTLLHKPELVFLDEPTAGLDPVAARHVHETITRLSHQEHHTVFLCTHNLAEAQLLCDRVAVLEHGRILALGSPAELSHRFGDGQKMEIEIEPESVSAAIQILTRSPGITAESGENGVILVSGVSRNRIPDTLASLVSGGIRVFRVTPSEPSLEDIYFALYEKKEVPV